MFFNEKRPSKQSSTFPVACQHGERVAKFNNNLLKGYYLDSLLNKKPAEPVLQQATGLSWQVLAD